MPVARLSKKNIAAFCVALKEMLLDRTSHIGKEYLRMLLDEIRVIKKDSALARKLCGTRKCTIFWVSLGL